MKTFQISLLSFLLMALSNVGFAQTKTEKIKVAGECGMCKKKIETAAKKAGASYALWSADKKELTVKYNSTSTNAAKIEKAVAAVGYDTKNYKAADATYENLDECCKYERSSSNNAKADCCKNCSAEKCGDCCKDGKCTDCKDCKDGKCSHEMACCKDGKCEHHSEEANAAKSGHGCCKKA